MPSVPYPSSRYVPYAIDISSKSGRPPLFREAFSKVRLSILCRHSGDRIPPNGAGCSTVALGSVAGQVVEPVLYLPLSIYLVYVNYILPQVALPRNETSSPAPGSGPPAQADSQRQTTSGAQSVAERVQGLNAR